jgi:hypothetical protein
VVVLTEAEETIEIGRQCVGSHEPQEGADVEVFADVPAEILVGSKVDQSGEVDDPLCLGSRRVALWLILPLVGRPVVTEKVDAAHADGGHQQAVAVSQLCFEKARIDALDDRVQAEHRPVVTAGNGQRDLGEGGCRSRHAGSTEDFECERFAGLRRVERHGVQLQRACSDSDLIVRIGDSDLERPFQIAGGNEVGNVTRVANGDVLQHMAVGCQSSFGPGKNRSKRVPFTLTSSRNWRRGGRTRRTGKRRLHRVVFFRRQRQVDRPDFRQAEALRHPLRLLSRQARSHDASQKTCKHETNSAISHNVLLKNSRRCAPTVALASFRES